MKKKPKDGMKGQPSKTKYRTSTPPTQCRYKCICGATFELWWDFEAHDCSSNKNRDENVR